MILDTEEKNLFFKLYFNLLAFADKRFKILNVNGSSDVKGKPLDKIVGLRNQIFDNLDIMDEFINKNPGKFSGDELEIIRSWKLHHVRGTFFIVKYLKRYTVLLRDEDPPKAFGVLGLNDPLYIPDFPLPILVETILLPFKGKIVYDGLLNVNTVIFGPTIKREIYERYKLAKAIYGIITTLPIPKKSVEFSDEEKLKFYLSDKTLREKYAEEIEELIAKTQN